MKKRQKEIDDLGQGHQYFIKNKTQVEVITELILLKYWHLSLISFLEYN
jgi:hypothetical protein